MIGGQSININEKSCLLFVLFSIVFLFLGSHSYFHVFSVNVNNLYS
jgi:hypothetical protein